MKALAIFYFSGTDTTEIAAELLSREFSRQQFRVDMFRIEDILKKNRTIELAPYELVGIGSPVIGFGTPEIVHRFIRALPAGNGIKTFIFKTAGGVGVLNYNASKPAIRLLVKKGYQVFYERIFTIGCNWALKFDDNVTCRLYEATGDKIKIMCQELLAGRERLLKTGWGLRLMIGIMMRLDSFFMRMVGKHYYVSRFCTHCGLCIRNCPVENIFEKKNKIKFHWKCLCCMRCIYSCPQHAINVRLLSFFIVPGGYDIRKSLAHPVTPNKPTSAFALNFLKNYVENKDL